MKKRLFAFLTLLGLVTTSAFAQIHAIDHWYIGTSGSLDWHRQTELVSSSFKENVDYDLGWDIKLNAGIEADNWRLELEGSYRMSDVDDVRVTNTAGNSFNAATGGHIENWSLLANIFYDIPLYKRSLYLYIGAGAGFSIMNLEINTFNGDLGGTNTIFTNADDTDAVFAWQLMVGLHYDIPTCNCHIPYITPYVGYRFFATTEPKGFGRLVSSSATAINTEHDFFPYANSIDIGIRIKF